MPRARPAPAPSWSRPRASCSCATGTSPRRSTRSPTPPAIRRARCTRTSPARTSCAWPCSMRCSPSGAAQIVAAVAGRKRFAGKLAAFEKWATQALGDEGLDHARDRVRQPGARQPRAADRVRRAGRCDPLGHRAGAQGRCPGGRRIAAAACRRTGHHGAQRRARPGGATGVRPGRVGAHADQHDPGGRRPADPATGGPPAAACGQASASGSSTTSDRVGRLACRPGRRRRLQRAGQRRALATRHAQQDPLGALVGRHRADHLRLRRAARPRPADRRRRPACQ